MEPGTPTSFIPKRPIETGVISSPRMHHGVGIVSLLSFVIVLGTAASFGGVYLYQKQLTAQKVKLEQNIAVARDGIGIEFVSDMKRLDARISGVKDLIKSHIVVTPIFEALEASTLHSVQYKDFKYGVSQDQAAKATPTVIVTMSGTAKNYATIALQSDAFSSNQLIKNPVFSNLTVDDKTRTVNFKLTFSVDVADLSYQTFVDRMLKEQATTPTANTQTP